MNDMDDMALDSVEQAARWLIRLRETPDDDQLLSEWLAWCEAAPDNLATFERLRSTWQLMGEASAAAGEQAPVVHDLRGRRRPSLDELHARRRPWPWRVGAKPSAWRRLAQAAAVAAVLVAGVALVARVLPPLGTQTLSTPLAVHGSSALPDGSQVEIGALSRISTRYSERERRVRVESGEAYFEVARDRRRPFVVEVDGLIVTAVGTAFNVRRDEARVVVTVSEGRVRLDAPRDAAPLEAGVGEQLVYSASERRIVRAVEVDPEVATAWRQGVLKFVHAPLDQVVADLNRYSRRPIRLGDARLAELRYTGTVFSGQLDDWLEAMSDVFPVRVESHGRDGIVLQPRG